MAAEGLCAGVALFVALGVVRTMNFYVRDPRCKLGVVGICRVRVVGSVVIALLWALVGACVRSSSCLAVGGCNLVDVVTLVGGTSGSCRDR